MMLVSTMKVCWESGVTVGQESVLLRWECIMLLLESNTSIWIHANWDH
jgi:hypothetical protein